MTERIEILKSLRLLTAYEGGRVLLRCRIALGDHPVGPKEREGDGRTPEGAYCVCLKKDAGRWGPGLGISYPGPGDWKPGMDEALRERILAAWQSGSRPPWGSPLGGEIYIHGGGTDRDWTRGCIALADEDIARLYPVTPLGTPVLIRP